MWFHLTGGSDLEKFRICGHEDRGENIAAALFGIVRVRGDRFVVGKLVPKVDVLSLRLAVPVGLRRSYGGKCVQTAKSQVEKNILQKWVYTPGYPKKPAVYSEEESLTETQTLI